MQASLESERLDRIDYPIHELLARRRSPLAFSSRSVEADSLGSVLEAARWTPSSYNAQPWSFIVATRENAAEFDRLLGCLVDANLQWAQRAAVLIFSVAQLAFDHNGKPNRHALYDLGQAVSNMVIQATALGLSVHQMAGFRTEQARQVLGLPSGYEPITAIALGYEGDFESLSDSLRRRQSAPRTRKPLDSFVFQGRWGVPASFLAGEKGR